MALSRCIAGVGAAILLSTSTPAFGQSAADVSSARELFIEGSKLSGTGDWPNAQDRFERSLRLKRAPVTLYSLAVVETHTGRLVEALEHLHAFLAEPSSAATKDFEPVAKAEIKKLEARVGNISLVITPKDAEGVAVTIDGERVPAEALGVPRVVNPGVHVVAATARGWSSPGRSVSLVEGATMTITLAMAPVSVDAVPTPSEPLGAPTPSRLAPGPRSPASEAPQSRALPFALLGAGGAVLVVGLGVGLSGVKQASSATTHDGPDARSARAKGIAGDVLGGVGIAAAGVGAVILIVQATRARGPQVGVARLVGNGLTLGF